MRKTISQISVLALTCGALMGAAPALAQGQPPHPHGAHSMPSEVSPPAAVPARLPTAPGQDAFGAIQEIVGILEADPTTDWSKVDIMALRAHLIDMNEVTLNALAKQENLPDGVTLTVTGTGRTRGAIQRMLPAHANELTKLGFSARTTLLPDGVRMTVTSPDKDQAVKLKALGFIGILALGAHHQRHHLMMARGQFRH